MIWDAVVSPPHEEEKDVAVFCLAVRLPDKKVEATYGALWPKGRDVSHYGGAGGKSGIRNYPAARAGQPVLS